jgi:hypothetical protein
MTIIKETRNLGILSSGGRREGQGRSRVGRMLHRTAALVALVVSVTVGYVGAFSVQPQGPSPTKSRPRSLASRGRGGSQDCEAVRVRCGCPCADGQ